MTKSQILNKTQFFNVQITKTYITFIFEIWSLKIGDYLVIGAWNLGFNKSLCSMHYALCYFGP